MKHGRETKVMRMRERWEGQKERMWFTHLQFLWSLWGKRKKQENAAKEISNSVVVEKTLSEGIAQLPKMSILAWHHMIGQS